MVRDAAGRGAQVVCLPELFRTQYFCQREDAALFDLAEPIPGPTHRRALSQLAAAAEGRAHRVAVRTARAGRLSQHRRRARRRRQAHAASTARCTSPTIRSTTKSSTSRPAISAYRAFDTAVGRVGTLVCWDQWYPEGARLTALQGAHVLFYPTAIGWHPAEKAEYGAGAARRLAHHAARARHRQRRLCRGGQPRRARDRQHSRQADSRRRPGVLGRLVPLRSLRHGDCRSIAATAKRS